MNKLETDCLKPPKTTAH